MHLRLHVPCLLLAAMLALPMALSAQETGCEPGFRLFDHEHLATSPVCIPENPQRIAVLDLPMLEFMSTQQLAPVAVIGFGRDFIARSNSDINIDVAGLMSQSMDVGFPVNLEVLLTSNPDLIVAASWTLPDTGVEMFQQIAPTVVFGEFDEEHRDSVEFIAEVLNRAEAGEELLAEFDARVRALQAVLGDGLNSTNISIVNLETDSIALRLAGAFPDVVVRNVGLTRPEAQQIYDAAFVETQNEGITSLNISSERLPLLDGDYLFVYAADQDANLEAEVRARLDQLREDPLWRTLDVVQNDRLFVVGSHWHGFGIFEAHAIVDDLFRYVAEVDPAEVSPNPFLATNAEATPEATPAS